MQCRAAIAFLVNLLAPSSDSPPAREFSAVAGQYRSRLETNLLHNIVPFWHPNTLDHTNGGYLLNHDVNGRLKSGGSKMIVSQARMVWFYSRLARAGYGRKYLDAAEVGHRFLRDKMWDPTNGGFHWEVDLTGENKLRTSSYSSGRRSPRSSCRRYRRALRNCLHRKG